MCIQCSTHGCFSTLCPIPPLPRHAGRRCLGYKHTTRHPALSLFPQADMAAGLSRVLFSVQVSPIYADTRTPFQYDSMLAPRTGQCQDFLCGTLQSPNAPVSQPQPVQSRFSPVFSSVIPVPRHRSASNHTHCITVPCKERIWLLHALSFCRGNKQLCVVKGQFV